MMTAPVIMANLFTTLVIAIRPTFWLKEVIGMQPKSEEKLLTSPSQVMEPEISFSLTLRRRPIAVIAEVSPIVSVAVVFLVALVLNFVLPDNMDEIR